MEKYAIVGFGCAGYHAAKALRDSNFSGEIHVYERTGEPPANPMLTTYYASDKLSLEGAYPFGKTEDIKRELSLDFKENTIVKKIHLHQKQIETEKGEWFEYNKILIATGAKAIMPAMKPDKRVLLMRTMEDARKLKAYLEENKVERAVVVGASMVGIKLVELLYNKGIKTTLADMAPFLFPLAAYENVGRELERRLTEKGIEFKWKAGIQDITPKGAVFHDGTELEADLICLSIGTRANLDLVANLDTIEGQDLKINRGIVVNSRMETNIPGIYAAGDCCEGTNLQTNETMIIGLWANAGCQGETAGKNMAGVCTEYAGNIVHNITHYMHTDFIGLGDTRLRGETISFGDITSDLYIQAVVKEETLKSVNLLGGRQISGILKSYFMKQLTDGKCELSDFQKGILIKNGVSMEFIEKLGGRAE